MMRRTPAELKILALTHGAVSIVGGDRHDGWTVKFRKRREAEAFMRDLSDTEQWGSVNLEAGLYVVRWM